MNLNWFEILKLKGKQLHDVVHFEYYIVTDVNEHTITLNGNREYKTTLFHSVFQKEFELISK